MPEPLPKTSRRDPFLDGWRGIFHVVMLVDHMPFVLPGIFPVIAGLYEIAGYVTVAEGFVFLSGFVSGLVYTRIRRERGRAAVWRKALARAAGIYVCYVLAVMALLALVHAFGRSSVTWSTWEPLLNQPLSTAFVQVAGILQQPTFLEILPMYSALLLLVPLLVSGLEKGWWPVILTLSFALWVTAQFSARTFLLNLLPFHSAIHPGYFNALAWQVLFITGLACGHRTYTKGARWLPEGWALPMAAYIVICLLLFMRHGWLGAPAPRAWTDRSTVGPLRLLEFLSIVFLVSKFRPRLEKWITWRGLAFLSRNSLQVFAFHLYPVYIVALLMLPKQSELPVWGQLIVVTWCIAGLFVIAYFTRWARALQQRLCGLRRPSPAGLAPNPQ